MCEAPAMPDCLLEGGGAVRHKTKLIPTLQSGNGLLNTSESWIGNLAIMPLATVDSASEPFLRDGIRHPEEGDPTVSLHVEGEMRVPA
jgi:hypothetical protein